MEERLGVNLSLKSELVRYPPLSECFMSLAPAVPRGLGRKKRVFSVWPLRAALALHGALALASGFHWRRA